MKFTELLRNARKLFWRSRTSRRQRARTDAQYAEMLRRLNAMDMHAIASAQYQAAAFMAAQMQARCYYCDRPASELLQRAVCPEHAHLQAHLLSNRHADHASKSH